MRKIYFIVLLLVLATQSYGQEINGVKIEDITSEYISITGFNELNGAWLRIDFGQELTTMKETPLTRSRKDYKFKSIIHSVEVFSEYNYEVIEYSITSNGSKAIKSYLLKKTK